MKRLFRNISFLLSIILLGSGCGGLGIAHDAPGCTSGFINQSGVPLEQLQQQWATAQIAVTKGVAINALDVSLYGAAPRTTGPNPGAASVQPNCTEVTSLSDATVQQLTQYDPRYASYHDPTGLILCDACSPHIVHSYVYVDPPAKVYVAASIASYGVEYEFENIILHQLGFDTSQR